ncbi:MAG TPA: MerR family transcriptional regulator [Candidatus Acetothermia bacterium]|nr:MerR family transcriptional regulator [Candidatus Acetothermia bacterium]
MSATRGSKNDPGESPRVISTAASRRPVYPISVAAELAGVHPRTLYMYEKQQLLIPARRGTWRFYSEDDLAWIRVIRYLLHDSGINIAGLQRLLALIPCTEICRYGADECCECCTMRTKSMPCWAVSATRGDRKCYECEVYQTARSWVCSPEELEQAELGDLT